MVFHSALQFPRSNPYPKRLVIRFHPLSSDDDVHLRDIEDTAVDTLVHITMSDSMSIFS